MSCSFQEKNPKTSSRDVYWFLLFMAGLVLLAGITGWFLYEIPQAAHAETVRQRAVAAGKWRHVPGYHDYMQFVERNP